MPGKRRRGVPLSIRLSPVIRDKVLCRAEMNDRSITAEVEYLLEFALMLDEWIRNSLNPPPTR